MRSSTSLLTVLLCAVVAALAGARVGIADDVLSKLKAAKQRAARQTYHLQYKFRQGETIRYKVVHRTTTETRITATMDETQTRSASTKAWRVIDVDRQGHATFTHMVEDVSMWNRISRTVSDIAPQPIRSTQESKFDSRKDEEPPLGYETVVKDIGVPLATVKIDPYGEMLSRQDREGYSATRGERLVVRLAPQPVGIGDRWSCPHEIFLRSRNGLCHRVKTRKLYQLEKVSAGVAYIKAETQVLTPIHSPELKGQLVKWLSSGVIKFDIDAGRVLSQEFDVDERIIGFNGADSMMDYVAQWTEKLLPAEAKLASRATPK